MARSKKDFEGMNTGRMYERLDQATSTRRVHKTPTQAEQEERRESMNTQGAKGCGMKRINFAFRDSNYEFILILARASGKTMTAVINLIIDAYRKEHPELLQHAKQVQAEMEESVGLLFDQADEE